jgi:hypothetical protein
MFVHKGPQDLPDLDLEVSSLHEQAVSALFSKAALKGCRRMPRASSRTCARSGLESM